MPKKELNRDPHTTTIQEAKDWINDGALKKPYPEHICPCCTQNVKVYPRKLNYAFTIPLVILYRDFGKTGEWVQVSKYLLDHYPGKLTNRLISNWEWPKLTHWGFLEEKGGRRADGSNRTGYYRVTHEGAQFVLRRTKAMAAFLLFNKRVVGFPDDCPLIWIDETFDKHFNYRDMMNASLSDYLSSVKLPKEK